MICAETAFTQRTLECEYNFCALVIHAKGVQRVIAIRIFIWLHGSQRSGSRSDPLLVLPTFCLRVLISHESNYGNYGFLFVHRGK